MKKYCVIKISHGSGAEFMTAAVIVRELAEKYKKVYVISFNKYFVDSLALEFSNVESFGMDSEQPLMNTVMNSPDDFDLIIDHPYNTGNFALRRDNFYDAYRSVAGLPRKNDWTSNGTKIIPEIKFIPNTILDSVSNFRKEHKKFVLVQFAGGQNPVINGPYNVDSNGNPVRQAYVYEEKGLKRHYPIEKAEKLVALLVDKGYEVVQYALPNEPHIKGCIYLQTEQNQIFYYKLADYASGIITIDSSLQHLSVHAKKPMVVIWVQTDINAFGYDNEWTVNMKKEYKPICPLLSGLPDTPIVSYPEPEEIMEKFNKFFVEKK